MSKEIDLQFQEAFDSISQLDGLIPQDDMLRLYAFYKQATSGNLPNFNGVPDVIDAFKFNAWTQLNGMSKEEAKQEYINLSDKILKRVKHYEK